MGPSFVSSFMPSTDQQPQDVSLAFSLSLFPSHASSNNVFLLNL